MVGYGTGPARGPGRRQFHRSRFATLALAVAVGIAVAACGSDARSTSGSLASSQPTTTNETATTRSTPTTLAHRTDATAVAAPPGASTVVMANWAFEPSTVTVTAGTAVIFLINGDPEPTEPGQCMFPDCYDHSMKLTGPSGAVLAESTRLAPGHVALFTIDALPAGEYSFHCPILTHAGHGMRGTLVVNP